MSFLTFRGRPTRGSSSFLLLVGTIRLLVDECVLTLWQRTKNRQFLRVNIIYFSAIGDYYGRIKGSYFPFLWGSLVTI